MYFSRVRIKDDRGTLVDVFDASSPSVNILVLSQDSDLTDLIVRIAAAKLPDSIRNSLSIHFGYQVQGS